MTARPTRSTDSAVTPGPGVVALGALSLEQHLVVAQ